MDAGQILKIISIISFTLAGILFVTAVFMFIKLNIPAIIGDLSGRTAQKQIQEIREQNAITGDKRYRPGAINIERGKLTEPVEKNEIQVKKVKPGYTVKASQTGIQEFDMTSEKTDVLESDGSEILASETEELTNYTEALEDTSGTELLSSTEELKPQGDEAKEKNRDKLFEIIEDIVVVHTDEIIS